MKLKFNGAQHRKNKMPEKPTLEQRVKWHLAQIKIPLVDLSLKNFSKK
jgi:hypothetical protein